MPNYTINQKNRVIKKLSAININTEKEIYNLKVSELKKLKEQGNFTIKELEIIWLIQEAIEQKNLFKFFVDNN